MAMAISVPLYTVDDLKNFPDDGNRYELLDGVLLLTRQAAAPHQIVASRIQTKLAISLQEPQARRLFCAWTSAGVARRLARPVRRGVHW